MTHVMTAMTHVMTAMHYIPSLNYPPMILIAGSKYVLICRGVLVCEWGGRECCAVLCNWCMLAHVLVV